MAIHTEDTHSSHAGEQLTSEQAATLDTAGYGHAACNGH